MPPGVPVIDSGGLCDDPVDMLVGFSNQTVGAAVAEYFRTKGWERVGVTTGDYQRAAVRRNAFIATSGRSVPTAVVPAPSSLAWGCLAANDLFTQDLRLEAVYCSFE